MGASMPDEVLLPGRWDKGDIRGSRNTTGGDSRGGIKLVSPNGLEAQVHNASRVANLYSSSAPRPIVTNQSHRV